MNRQRRVVLLGRCSSAVLLVAVLVACGSGETEVASGSATTANDGAPTRTSTVTATDGSRYLRHEGAWRLAGTDENGRVLIFDVPISGCTKFHTIEVDEQPQSVRLTVVVETFLEGPADGEFEVACSQELGRRRATVQLQAPLGERQLLGECAPRGAGDVDCASLSRF